jgi:hypothetical protein
MATATQWAHNTELDTRKRSSTARDFEDALRQKIVGQDEVSIAIPRKKGWLSERTMHFDYPAHGCLMPPRI